MAVLPAGQGTTRGRVWTITALAVTTVVLLLPSLVLEARLFGAIHSVGGRGATHHIAELAAALAREEAGVLRVVRTAGDATLSDFERVKQAIEAQAAVDAAVTRLAANAELAPQVHRFTVLLAELRRMTPRDRVVSIGVATAHVAMMRRVISAMHVALLAQTAPKDSQALSAAHTLSDAAAAWAAGGSRVLAAFASPTRSFASAADAAVCLSQLADAEAAVADLPSLGYGAAADAIDPRRVLAAPRRSVSVAALRDRCRDSVRAFRNSTVTLPASLRMAAANLSEAFAAAEYAVANVRPTAKVELAQLLVNCVAIAGAIVAAICSVYVLASGLGAEAGAGRDAAVEHMISAYRRVMALTARLLALDCTDASDVASGAALSAVEAELRGLLKPLAAAVAHIPRAALVPHPHRDAPTLLESLDAEPALRHNVSMLFIDLHFLNDAAYTSDTAKSLPGRAQRLRTTVFSEVLRRGGLPVMTPLNRWAFAWNLHGGDKGGIQSATQCAMNILSAATVDYPSMRTAVVTGSVGIGTAGSATYRSYVVAGTPVLIAPLALRVAQAHGAQLVVDAETHANCSSQTYRSRAIEVVAPEPGVEGTVLYNMLSSLDSHDQRLLQWNEAFEKYHTGRVQEALDGLEAWKNDGADASVRRLIGLLKCNPPATVTVGEGPARVFP